MPKGIVWTSIASSVFIVISVLESLAGKQDIALVTAINAIAFAILAIRDN